MRGSVKGRADEAFEIYFKMGPDGRSLRKVAEHVGVSIPTVKNWSSRFNWQERVRIMDEEVARGVQQKATARAVEERAGILKMVNAGIAVWGQKLQSGEIEIKRPADLAVLVDLRDRLLGQDEGADSKANQHILQLINLATSANRSE